MKLVKVPKATCEHVVPLAAQRRDGSHYVIPLRLGRCRGCETEVNTDNGYADLEGQPWVDYYCARCAAKATR